MQMKKIIVTLLVFLFFKQAFAFNLDAALEKLEDNTKVKIQDSLQDHNGKEFSLDSLADDLKDKASSELADLENKISKKIEKYDQEIKQKFDNIITNIEHKIKDIEDFKAKIERIITLVQILLSTLVLTLVGLIYFLWRAYRKINKLYNMLDNIYSYKDLNSRLTKLEEKINS